MGYFEVAPIRVVLGTDWNQQTGPALPTEVHRIDHLFKI